MPFDFETSQTATVVTVGTGSDISLVGGSGCFFGGHDTYLAVSNLDRVNGQGCIIEFPTINLPTGAIADFFMHVEYEQVSGANSGHPEFTWTESSSVSVGPLEFAAAGAGAIDTDAPHSDVGNWSPLFPPEPTDTPTQWDLGMAFDFFGDCDFRIYTVVLIVEWSLPVTGGCPPLRRYPRSDGLGVGPRRHYPPPISAQESNRRAGGFY